MSVLVHDGVPPIGLTDRRRRPSAPRGAQTATEPGTGHHLDEPEYCPGATPRLSRDRTDKLAKRAVIVGVDISKDRFDEAVLETGEGFRLDNDQAGWAALVKRQRRFEGVAIGIEPSGGYERGVARWLQRAGLMQCTSTSTSYATTSAGRSGQNQQPRCGG